MCIVLWKTLRNGIGVFRKIAEMSATEEFTNIELTTDDSSRQMFACD